MSSFRHKVDGRSNYKSAVKARNKACAPERLEYNGNNFAEIQDLEARISLECNRNESTLKAVTEESRSDAGPSPNARLFADLPLSKHTLRGLKAASFVKLTPIQAASIPRALSGGDIMGEAPTGSGKTLAFIIPLLEKLHRSLWNRSLGLGALIITPTRELATQIFDVLRKVGRFHDFSAAVLIGGKDMKFDAARLDCINIVVATPGRLLQHLDECANFDTTNLLVLVVDEADQLVDLGFEECMKNILCQLPPCESRQTWLFSATLNYAVRRLALISLNNPISLSVGLTNKPTPSLLKEMYMIITLAEQPTCVFSFLRAHAQKKIILFVNSCKQVRVLYETYRVLKPGIQIFDVCDLLSGPALFELHGRQNQMRRIEVLESFTRKIRAACLICTDLAARGLDIENVDWVVQLNCPFDVETYIHRVGRTARYHKKGSSVLFLLPSEKEFLHRLKEKSISPLLFSIIPEKRIPIENRLAAILASDPKKKHLAERALVSYLRSIALASDKSVFDVNALVHDESVLKQVVEGHGLISIPEEIRLMTANVAPKKLKQSKLERLKEKIMQKKKENVTKLLESLSSDETCEMKKLSKTEKRRQKLRNLRQSANEEVSPLRASHDDVLVPTGHLAEYKEPLKTSLNTKQQKRMQERIRKEQIRIRADGTAKIKGFAMLDNTEDKHIFFDDSNENQLVKKTPFQHIVNEMNSEADTMMQGNLTTYEKHLEGLHERLLHADKVDKVRDKERIHDRNVRLRNKQHLMNLSIGAEGVMTDETYEEESDYVMVPAKKLKSRSESISKPLGVEALEARALKILAI